MPGDAHQCDACDALASGYPWTDLREQGWRREVTKANGGHLTLCDACVKRFERARELRAITHVGQD